MSENENDFESLRRLLALKRLEQPPPGYFSNFSDEVITRIRAGETGSPERPFGELPWLFKILQAFEAKPSFAGAFASVLCLLLLAGIVYAERPETSPQTLLQPSAQVTVPVAEDTSPHLAVQPVNLMNFVSSTNPVFTPQPVATVFGQQDSPLFQPATYSP